MKKWIFGLVFALVAVLSVSLASNAKAATLTDTANSDDFETGISEDYKALNDEAGAFKLTEKPGQVKLSGMDYNNGYLRTKDSITVPEGSSLVVQFEVYDSDSAGWFALGKGSADTAFGTAWGDMIYYGMKNGTNMVNEANGAIGYQMPNEVNSAWANSHLYTSASLQRQVYHADGSAEMYGAASYNEADLSEFYCYKAGQIKNVGSGYVGFMGNGFTGYIIMDNIKIGTMNDTTGEITWVIEDTCDSMDNWVWEGSSATCLMGGAKYFEVENSADGAALVLKEAYTAPEDCNKLLSQSLTVNVSALDAGKVLGVVYGVEANATDAKAATVLGVTVDTDGNLVLEGIVNGEVKKSAVVGTAADYVGVEATLTTTVEKNDLGRAIITATLGNASIALNVASVDGLYGIATLGEGDVSAKILNYSYATYKTVEEESGNYATSFDSEEDLEDYYVVQGSTGTIKVVDGVLRFNNPGDGAEFAVNAKYVNFIMQFDVLKQQADEAEDGTAIPASTWVGVNIGKEAVDTLFYNAPLFYQGLSTLDALNLSFTNDSTRIWTNTAQDLNAADNNEKWWTITVVAQDGVAYYYSNEKGADLNLVGTTTEMNTDGYVSIACTAGAYFDIDNFCIINTDNEMVDSTFAVAAYDGLVAKVMQAEDANAALQAELDAANASIEAANADKAALQAELDAANAAKAQAESDKAALQSQLDAANAANAALQAELDAANENSSSTVSVGCGSVIGISTLSIIAAIGACGLVILKKREDK